MRDTSDPLYFGVYVQLVHRNYALVWPDMRRVSTIGHLSLQGSENTLPVQKHRGSVETETKRVSITRNTATREFGLSTNVSLSLALLAIETNRTCIDKACNIPHLEFL